MKAGKIVEEGPTERVLFAPGARYTRDLLAAIPHPTFEPEQADPARVAAGS
jgi:peptide/nickel transport system ATP-binding protein